MVNVFPAVIKVGFLPCISLSPSIPLKARSGVPVAVLTDVNYVNMIGTGKLHSVSTSDKRGSLDTATLEFFTLDAIPHREHLAWVAECADGSQYIIGAKEPPFPTIEVDFSSGDIDSERAGYSVKVSWKSINGAAKVGV